MVLIQSVVLHILNTSSRDSVEEMAGSVILGHFVSLRRNAMSRPDSSLEKGALADEPVIKGTFHRGIKCN